jgi:hypothetical protein
MYNHLGKTKYLFCLLIKYLVLFKLRIFQYPVTVAAFRRYTQDKTRYRTQAEINGFSFILGNPTNKSIINVISEVCIFFVSISI